MDARLLAHDNDASGLGVPARRAYFLSTVRDKKITSLIPGGTEVCNVIGR